MDQNTETRLRSLIDPHADLNDPVYHATVSQFRLWLKAADMAMRDEDVDQEVIERVLNRMTYGAPNPRDAYLRIDHFRRVTDEAARLVGDRGGLPPGL